MQSMKIETTDLECFVPASSREDAALRRLNRAHNLDRRVMLGDLRALASLDIKHTCRIVASA
jgi:hypothetical protein